MLIEVPETPEKTIPKRRFFCSYRININSTWPALESECSLKVYGKQNFRKSLSYVTSQSPFGLVLANIIDLVLTSEPQGKCSSGPRSEQSTTDGLCHHGAQGFILSAWQARAVAAFLFSRLVASLSLHLVSSFAHVLNIYPCIL